MKQDLFEKTPVPKAYLTLAMPVVLGMMVTLVYNMIDTYFIALTGNTGLVAGVSLAAPVFTLMIAFGDIWGLGGSSLISRLLGEKEYEAAKRASSFCFWAAILFGVFVTTVLLLFRTPILRILGATESTWQYASQYYTWIAIGAASIILGLVPNNILRTEGFATQSMFGSILGSVVNIILDPIFIFVLGKGAAGAAMATVIGNCVADLFFVYIILTKSKRLSISLKLFRIPGERIAQILAIGIPASITNIMQSFMITITNQYLLPYGDDKIAAMGIAMKVNMISVLILVGFAFGGQPLIGYCYGAKNKQRLKETMKFAYVTAAISALIFSLVLIALAPVIIHGFMKDPQIVASGSFMLRCLQTGLVFMSVSLVSTCICQSFGKAAGAFALSVSRQGVCYFAAIVLLSALFGYKGILLSQLCADLTTAILAVFIIRNYSRKLD